MSTKWLSSIAVVNILLASTMTLAATGESKLTERKQTTLGLYVTAAEAYAKLMAAPGKVTLIDVRTPEEHALVGHPEMAWNVPFAFVTYRRKDGKTECGPNRMAELKDKKIGLSKNLNTIKNDWWRIQEQQGIQLMLRLNGMTRADVERVEFPYPDDWYDNPEMMGPLMENPS